MGIEDLEGIFKAHGEMQKITSANLKAHIEASAAFTDRLYTWARKEQCLPVMEMLQAYLHAEQEINQKYREMMNLLLMHIT